MKRIPKRQAYQFGFEGVIIPRETLALYGQPTNATRLRNMTAEELEAVVEAVEIGDTKDGNNRYCFYYVAVNGKVVNAYDSGIDEQTGEWLGEHEYSGQEFKKFYNLVRV